MLTSIVRRKVPSVPVRPCKVWGRSLIKQIRMIIMIYCDVLRCADVTGVCVILKSQN
jgi:hypothetical protein